ncbi:RF-1 domain-containing protein [Cadophora sp. MPI-SDFR-AT-0126]|nr:RF-1 domain-containing protein [Leotiomycetes sp. MPI-SDFR-AT-0126]
MIRGQLSCISRGRRPILESLTGVALPKHSVVGSTRGIAATSPAWAKKMPDRPQSLDESELTEAFLKGSGPGGQKINKTSSAVQLKHIPSGMVLKVQATRSRTQNRKIARQMLAERVEEMEKGKESRIAVVGETKRKRKSSAVKKSKRKYRLLDEAKRDCEEVKEIDENEGKDMGTGKGEN